MQMYTHTATHTKPPSATPTHLACRPVTALQVCDRGANTRLEKSAAVKYAGGAGMLLLNGFDPGLLSLDSEYHSVPTIQLQVSCKHVSSKQKEENTGEV